MAKHQPNKPSMDTLPEGFWRVRLNLAREAVHPEGSRAIGYELIIPLTREGKIDVAAWREHREYCRLVHFRADEENEAGHMVRRPGGSWAFHYDIHGDEEDAAGYHFQNERFVTGEYVSIREVDGMHTYIVAAVEKL
jgi:hypothetical protein